MPKTALCGPHIFFKCSLMRSHLIKKNKRESPAEHQKVQKYFLNEMIHKPK